MFAAKYWEYLTCKARACRTAWCDVSGSCRPFNKLDRTQQSLLGLEPGLGWVAKDKSLNLLSPMCFCWDHWYWRVRDTNWHCDQNELISHQYFSGLLMETLTFTSRSSCAIIAQLFGLGFFGLVNIEVSNCGYNMGLCFLKLTVQIWPNSWTCKENAVQFLGPQSPKNQIIHVSESPCTRLGDWLGSFS